MTLRPACPDCNGLDLRQRQRGHWSCKTCGWKGADPVFRERLSRGGSTSPAPTSKGSGQIAGRITIPQLRWGSSRLG